MEVILQRLEEAEQASSLKYTAIKGAFNELLAQAIGIKTENDQLRKSLKAAEEASLELRSDSFLKQTELENANKDLREKLKAAEETCNKQAGESTVMQNELLNLRHDRRSHVCRPEPMPTKRPCPQDDQPDLKSKLTKTSHHPRLTPSYTPISPTPQPIPQVFKNEEAVVLQALPRYIYRNKYGERIDPQIHPRPDPRIVYDIRAAQPKLCNNFYLNGNCPYEPCVNDHSTKLDEEERHALRHVARLVPCKHGRFCVNGRCTAGHSCPQSEWCVRSRCKWPPEMHGIDAEVYEKLRA